MAKQPGPSAKNITGDFAEFTDFMSPPLAALYRSGKAGMCPFSIDATTPLVETVLSPRDDGHLEIVVFERRNDGISCVDDSREPAIKCVGAMTGNGRLVATDIGSHIGVDLDFHAAPKSD